MMFNIEMIVKNMKGGKEYMAEKRYYQRDFEELYYIIDSNVISEKEFDEKEMYDGYTAFEDSMTGEEIVDLLNTLNDENEQLKKENYKLHKRLGDFEQFEEHIKERTSKTFVKECVYFDSVLGVCDIDGSVNCPCENYEELVRWIDD